MARPGVYVISCYFINSSGLPVFGNPIGFPKRPRCGALDLAFVICNCSFFPGHSAVTNRGRGIRGCVVFVQALPKRAKDLLIVHARARACSHTRDCNMLASGREKERGKGTGTQRETLLPGYGCVVRGAQFPTDVASNFHWPRSDWSPSLRYVAI